MTDRKINFPLFGNRSKHLANIESILIFIFSLEPPTVNWSQELLSLNYLRVCFLNSGAIISDISAISIIDIILTFCLIIVNFSCRYYLETMYETLHYP